MNASILIAVISDKGRMAFVALLLLSLFWSKSLVYCLSFPHVSFMGQALANHSYVDLSLVGSNDSGSVQCITDLQSCCSVAQGVHRGDWYFPNGTRLPFFGNGDVNEYRESQRVHLHRRSHAHSPSGVYCCDIPTYAIHYPSVRERVYVGLYTGSGGMYSFPIHNEKAIMSYKQTLCSGIICVRHAKL